MNKKLLRQLREGCVWDSRHSGGVNCTQTNELMFAAANEIERLDRNAKTSTELLNANSARLLEATAMVRSLLDNWRPLTESLERLQTIVDKLPKTADGVHIGPDTVVYQQQTKDGGKTWDVVPHRVTSSYWPFPGWIRSRCYSTPEAAQSAIGQKQPENAEGES